MADPLYDLANHPRANYLQDEMIQAAKECLEFRTAQAKNADAIKALEALTENWDAEAEAVARTQLNIDRLLRLGLREHYEAGYDLQYGKYAQRPSISLHAPLAVWEDIMKRTLERVKLGAQSLMNLVFIAEDRIQQEVETLANNDPDRLKTILEGAWTTTVAWFNQLAEEQEGFEEVERPLNTDFRLDPNSSIPEVSAPDLSVFSEEFLKDHLYRGEGQRGYDELVPIYQTGANYRDLRELYHQKGDPPPVEQGNISYNDNLVEHPQKIRASYLVPHINLQDLADPLNLLSFIHYRARVPSWCFAPVDNELMYTGRQTKILSGNFCFNRTVSFYRDLECWTGCGRKPTGCLDKFFYMKLYYLKRLFGFSEAFLILKSQAFTYMFLTAFCEKIVESPTLEPEPSEEYYANVQARASRRLHELKHTAQRGTWLRLAALKNYEPIAPSIEVKIFSLCWESRIQRSEEHLGKLFDDPDHFAQHVIQERQHHWCNVILMNQGRCSTQIEQYSTKSSRHHLYYDCLRRVLRRAIFEFFMWPRVKEALLEFTRELEKAQPGHGNLPTLRAKAQTPWPDPPILADLEWFRSHHTHPQETHSIDPEARKGLLHQYQHLVILVRYCAIFFLNDFRVHAIHAGSEPLRSEFVRCGEDMKDPPKKVKKKKKRADKEVCNFDRGHYRGVIRHFERSRGASSLEGSKRTICMLIDNFIADEAASMHIGIRRVTQHLQEILDDQDDVEFKNITGLVADSIDGLDILAELADHLERWHPMIEDLRNEYEEKAREEMFSSALGNTSIDFMGYDEFPFEKDAVPQKRIGRIFQFLDEMQGFDNAVRSTSEARGDLKRLGASLLRDTIEKINVSLQHKASEETIQRLEKCMGVARKDFPFHEDEEPYLAGEGGLTIDVDGQTVPRRMPDKSRYGDEAAKFQRRPKNKWVDTGFGEIVLDHIKRREAIAKRTRMERARWDRRKRRHRATQELLARREEETPSSPRQARDPDSMDIDEDEAGPKDGTGHDGQPTVQPQPAEPVLQLPLPPAPPIQPAVPTPKAPKRPTQPVPPKPVLAPDNGQKKELSKRVWSTFKALYRVSEEKVTWNEVVLAMAAIGYSESGHGGSHAVFNLTPSHRWGDGDLPKGKSVQLSKYHGGAKTPAPKLKVADWGRFLEERALDWRFIKTWHCVKA